MEFKIPLSCPVIFHVHRQYNAPPNLVRNSNNANKVQARNVNGDSNINFQFPTDCDWKRRRQQLAIWIRSKLRNDGTSVFAPNYLVIYAKCCRTISSSELSQSLNKSAENDSIFRPLQGTRRNNTINDASTIQDKDYTFLQCKQTFNRCSHVHLPFRWNKQTIFFTKNCVARGCKEINQWENKYCIELHNGILSLQNSTIRKIRFLSKCLIYFLSRFT